MRKIPPPDYMTDDERVEAFLQTFDHRHKTPPRELDSSGTWFWLAPALIALMVAVVVFRLWW